jgi:hypothetical protein
MSAAPASVAPFLPSGNLLLIYPSELKHNAKLYLGPYSSRNYFLRNLTHPPDMLERGVRQYFQDNLRGLPVSGWIQRRYDERLDDQYLFLYLVGSPECLQEIENNLLNSKPAYWMWSSSGTESHDSLGAHYFFIKKNGRHAIKGPNSDPMNEYDYQPPASHSSSRSSPSLPSIKSKKLGRDADEGGMI